MPDKDKPKGKVPEGLVEALEVALAGQFRDTLTKAALQHLLIGHKFTVDQLGESIGRLNRALAEFLKQFQEKMVTDENDPLQCWMVVYLSLLSSADRLALQGVKETARCVREEAKRRSERHGKN